MSNLIPVRKDSYKQLRKAELVTFAGNVSQRMSTDPEYLGIQEEAKRLGELANSLKVDIENAKDRSIPHSIIKKQSTQKVIQSLDAIVNWMRLNYPGDELWVAKAGFVVYRGTERIIGNELPAPSNLYVARTLVGEGEIVLRFKPKGGAKTHAVEYSADNGETWKNGHYGNSLGIRVKGIPVRQEILFRVRALGTKSRISPWSETLTTFVV